MSDGDCRVFHLPVTCLAVIFVPQFQNSIPCPILSQTARFVTVLLVCFKIGRENWPPGILIHYVIIRANREMWQLLDFISDG